jgi:hypothetical protein
MARDKSIIEKFADTLRDVAKTATEAASEALKSEGPKAEDRTAGYVPLAADGLVADPLMVAPMKEARPRRKKRATSRQAAPKAAKRTARKAPKKSAKTSSTRAAKKAAKRTSARRSTKAASKRGGTTARKTKAPAKRRVARSRRR